MKAQIIKAQIIPGIGPELPSILYRPVSEGSHIQQSDLVYAVEHRQWQRMTYNLVGTIAPGTSSYIRLVNKAI